MRMDTQQLRQTRQHPIVLAEQRYLEIPSEPPKGNNRTFVHIQLPTLLFQKCNQRLYEGERNSGIGGSLRYAAGQLHLLAPPLLRQLPTQLEGIVEAYPARDHLPQFVERRSTKIRG